MRFPCLKVEAGVHSAMSDTARKYGIRRSMKLEVVDTGRGILPVPIVQFDDLFGADPPHPGESG